MSNSIILNEEIDSDYEPKEDELIEYAKFIGMNFPEDEEFLYIAREGLKAPLPEPWKPCQTNSGDIYFFNFDTGQSVWEHPCDTYYKDLFAEAKSKKKSQSKKPPLQEAKDRQKKPVVALPKSVSPVGFEKKRDVLTEFIQLEKEFKDNKVTLKEKLEKDLQSNLRDISIQRDTEIKLFREQQEKESKKKLSGLTKELETLDEIERNNFLIRLEVRIREENRNNAKTIESEKRKVQDRIDKEILVYEKEISEKKLKEVELIKKSFEIEKKTLFRQIEEQKELIEKVKKMALNAQEEMKDEIKREEEAYKREAEKELEEYRKQQELEIQGAIVSARNKNSKSKLQEKIRDLKAEYKVKEEVEKRNLKRELDDEIKDLYKDSTVDSGIDKNRLEYERSSQINELINKYKIKKREEMRKIDQEYERMKQRKNFS